MSTKNAKAETVISVKDIGEDLQSDINRVAAEATITHRNRSGFFISEGRLKTMKSSIAELLRSGESQISPKTLLDLNNKVADLERKHHDSELRLQAAQADVAARKKDVVEMTKSLTAKEALLSKGQKEYESAISGLKVQITEAKNAVEEKKLQMSATFTKISREEKAAAEATFDRLKKALSELHSELAQERSNRKNEEMSISSLREKIALLEAERQKAAQLAKHMESNSYASAVKAGPNNQSLLLNEKALIAMLGEKAVAFLRLGDVAVVDNVRDKTFNLMLAAKNSSSNRVKSLAPLLTKLFEWLKTAGKRASLRVKKWVEVVYADIINLRVQTVEHYKQVLEELKLDIQFEVEQFRTKERKEMPNYRKNFKFSTGFIRKFLLGTRKSPTLLGKARIGLLATFHSVRKSITSFSFREFFNSWYSSSTESEILFDVEEEEKLLSTTGGSTPDVKGKQKASAGEAVPLSEVDPVPQTTDDEDDTKSVKSHKKRKPEVHKRANSATLANLFSRK